VTSSSGDPFFDIAYGVSLDGVAVVEVPVDVAPLFAEAHRRLTGARAVVHPGDGTFVDPLTGDAAAPAADPSGWTEPEGDVVERLTGAARPAVLVGPGVVRAGVVPALHAFAAAGSVGVLNTWGAKGIFDWRSRHHLATVGLQARDLELGGLAESDCLVVVGLDEREALADRGPAPVLELEPGHLGPLAERWRRPRGDIEPPPLRSGLAAITQAGWEVGAAPLPPTRITLHYSQLLGDGVVAADPGTAGYWVARTFGTTRLGGAHVPAEVGLSGFAVACAALARRLRPSRPALAVVDSLDGRTGEVLECARRLGMGPAVEVWSPDGEALGAEAHRARLRSLVRRGGVADLAVDVEPQLAEMIDFAGPVVAWTEPAGSPPAS
jgi:hypothetical protein